MVNYWFCVTNMDNWNIVKKRKTWGVSDRHKGQMEKVELGDILAFYVKGNQLAGTFKAISKPFKSDEVIFNSTGFIKAEQFQYRVKLEPLLVLEKPIRFDGLVPKLQFIFNKKKWGTRLMGRAMFTIPKEDYELIEVEIKKTLGS